MSLPGHYCHYYCPSIPEWRATVPGQRGFCLLFAALPCLAPLVIAGGGCNCACVHVCVGRGEGEEFIHYSICLVVRVQQISGGQ